MNGMETKYWINSNNGDYVVWDNNEIILVTDDGYKEITEEEFKELKGFVPIKAKKMNLLRGRRSFAWQQGPSSTSRTNWNKYKPTQKGGKK